MGEVLCAMCDSTAIAGRRRSGLVERDVMAYERRSEGRGRRERGLGDEQTSATSCAGMVEGFEESEADKVWAEDSLRDGLS